VWLTIGTSDSPPPSRAALVVFASSSPTSPHLSAAARLGDFDGLGISPTQWIAMGREATMETF